MTDQSVARVSAVTGRTQDDSRALVTNMNASGRLVDPQAVGNVIVMLCLPVSRDINGAAITIDGGTSA
jgi:3-hydroxybutyrate dehydrogenase